jgi:hypothetical protein
VASERGSCWICSDFGGLELGPQRAALPEVEVGDGSRVMSTMTSGFPLSCTRVIVPRPSSPRIVTGHTALRWDGLRCRLTADGGKESRTLPSQGSAVMIAPPPVSSTVVPRLTPR